MKVKCHHSGRFKTEGGKLNYVDGKVDNFIVLSSTIFEDVVLEMVGNISVNRIGNMWYILPFEDFKDRKPLWKDVDENRRKMSLAGRWGGEIVIIIENPELDEVNNVVGNGEDGLSGCSDDDCNEDDNEGGNEDDNEDANEDDEIAQENMVVFSNVNYDDEILDEEETYPDTESDDEEEDARKMARDGLLDGIFSLRQIFSTGDEFKENVIKYILKERRNVVFDRWDKEKLGAKCNGRGCEWRIYCSIEKPIQKWMVKTYVNKHTCHPTGKCKLIRSPIIADLILEDIRRKPEMSGQDIMYEMQKRHNIIVSKDQARAARRLALDELQAACNEQFARLRDYEMELLK